MTVATEERFWIVCHAPFAMHLQRYAGGCQATWPIPTPSESYGLTLNLACRDVNDYNAPPALPTCEDAPSFEIAIGDMEVRGRGEMLNHRHIYRVNKSNRDPMGVKNCIEPARRQVLVDTTFVIGVTTEDATMLARIEAGLRGELPSYGFLTAGNSDCMIDWVRILASPPSARWYCRLDPSQPPRPGSHRFPVWLDRRNQGRSRWAILAPTEKSDFVPERAWVRVGPS